MTQRLVLLSAWGWAPLFVACGAALAATPQPRVFAPGTISSATGVDCLTFMPDGKTVFFREGPWSDEMISACRGGHYLKAVRPDRMRDGMHEFDPAIAPDQSFTVLDAGRNGSIDPDHLYRAFREGAGWSTAIDPGGGIDAYLSCRAHLGPEGAAAYFAGSHTKQAHWPCLHEQAEIDLAQARASGNGTAHVYSVSLRPWLDAHCMPATWRGVLAVRGTAGVPSP